ncbi:MAG TPA: DUF6152 family protein [Vicinamibacterales bacterium]
MVRLRSISALGLLLAAVLLHVGVASAHHGTLVAYDRDKQWTADAVVTEFRYVNPHVQLYFDTTDARGKVSHWNGELLPNPAQLIATGWTRKRSLAALTTGTRIKVTVAPARAGGQVVLVLRVTNDKGEELLGGGALPGGPPAPAAADAPRPNSK